MGLDVTPKLVTLDEEDMKKVVLGAGQKVMLDLHIPTAGSVLSWNFKTDDYDAGFHVYFESVSPKNEIVSCPRCDSHINVQKGSLTCDKPGKCEFFCIFSSCMYLMCVSCAKYVQLYSYSTGACTVEAEQYRDCTHLHSAVHEPSVLLPIDGFIARKQLNALCS